MRIEELVELILDEETEIHFVIMNSDFPREE